MEDFYTIYVFLFLFFIFYLYLLYFFYYYFLFLASSLMPTLFLSLFVAPTNPIFCLKQRDREDFLGTVNY